MLELKHLPVSSFNENIAYIHRDCPVYKIDNIKTMTRIEIHGGAAPVYAFLQIVDSSKIIRPDELGLNTEAFRQIGLPEGSRVSLTLTPPAPSLASVRRKIAGNILSPKEYEDIVADISARRYSNMDIASFLVAAGSFITPNELLSLTEALRGDRIIDWGSEEIVADHHCLGEIPGNNQVCLVAGNFTQAIVADHHCLGEIPGNKADLIVTAIVAAYGLPMPKTVSRSLSGCTGAADTMEILAGTDLDVRSLKKQVLEKRGAIVNPEGLDIAAADKIISAVEQQNGLATLERSIASVLASKMAAGITHLLIDIPVGPRARVRSTQEAMRLRKLIEYVGDMMEINVDVVITDGSEPIGFGLGAALEARDVMKVLKNKEDAPDDLKEKSLFLAGRILEFDPKLRGGQGYVVARELLKSGKALDAMEQIIKSQGKAKEQVRLGHLTRDVVADVDGTVKKIDNAFMTRLCVLCGGGQYPGAGVDLFKKTGDQVTAGDILYRIYSCNQNDFAFAGTVLESGKSGFEIGK